MKVAWLFTGFVAIFLAAWLGKKVLMPEISANEKLLEQVDHLVYCTPDLEQTVDALETKLGVRATSGGSHPGAGTRNALISIGPGRYLEIMGPDPEQDVAPKFFGLSQIRSAKMCGWAKKGRDLPAVVRRAAEQGLQLYDAVPIRRFRKDGSEITWTLTGLKDDRTDGIAPFFIDWGNAPHPSSHAAVGPELVALRAEHPNGEAISKGLWQYGIPLEVRKGSAVKMIATFKLRDGQVVTLD